MTCSDDKTIRVWSFQKSNNTYTERKRFTEHNHFVLDIKLNPHEEGKIASASMDSNIKLWNIHSSNQKSNGTLSKHVKGVNCISYHMGDKNLLLSGGDDLQVIVWDLANRTSLAVLKHHNDNINSVMFMQEIPLFCSLSQDGMLNFYSTKNWEFQFDVMNFMDKGWDLAGK